MKIVFCHNVHVRFSTLLNTLKIEKQFFPNSHSVIAYNEDDPTPFFRGFKNIEFIKFNGSTHKIGCMNGCIASIQAALKHDPDVIIFSHDDVLMNSVYTDVIDKNIELVGTHMHDVICRTPKGIYGNNYYLMECFYINGLSAKRCFGNLKLYTDEQHIARDIRGSLSPEAGLHNILKIEGIKILEMDYEHKLEGYNDTLGLLMGFHHINAGERGWFDK